MKRWMLVVAIAVGVALGTYYARVNHPKNRPSYPPSWTDIQSLVKANRQWEEYKKGDQYLQALLAGTAHYPRANDPTSDARMINAVGTHVTVDFLATLTPAQVELLKDKLPFSKLTEQQKRLLRLEPGYHYNPKADLRNSYIRLVLRKFGRQPPYADFLWCTRDEDGREITIEDGRSNFFLKDVAKWQQPWG